MPIAAASPFDYGNADVILRSSDEVDFRVHKLILSVASPVFDSMFPFPHPTVSAEDNQDGLPVVRLAENCRTLDNLLRICYPTPDPELDDLEDIGTVFGAAKKYDMEAGLVFTLKALMAPKILEKDPFGVFVVAHHFRLKEETLAAAKATLCVKNSIPKHGSTSPLGLDDMPATVLLRLIQYQGQCRQEAENLPFETHWWEANQMVQYEMCMACHSEPVADSRWGPQHSMIYELDVQSIPDVLYRVVKRMPCRAPNLQAIFLREILHTIDEKSQPCILCRQNLLARIEYFSQDVFDEIDSRISQVRTIFHTQENYQSR